MKGTVDTLLAADSGATFLHPHGLPGDRALLFTLVRAQAQRLAVLDLVKRKVKPLDLVGSNPQYVGSGYLVYTSPEGTAHAVGFSLDKLDVTGEAVAIADHVRFGRIGNAMLVVSRSGTIVSAGGNPTERVLELVDRTGRGTPLSRRVGLFQDPRFSPDGRRIAVSLNDEIWVLDPAREALVRLSRDSVATRPAWSPDGRDLLFVHQGEAVTLRRLRADGTTPAARLLEWSSAGLWEGLYTTNGRSLIVRTVGQGARDIWLAPLEGGEPTVLVSTPASEVAPALSPDGRWLAYSSDESGQYEVYVRAFSGGERYLVSDGGTEPVWSADGKELFYRRGPSLIAASVRAGPAFTVLGRTELFSNPEYEVDPTHANYDVAPDGRHFVMVRHVGGANALTVTLNLFANLDRTQGHP
jgi:dipeptidyl aminopeptidase/acylaminoacyl peptidase